MNTASALPVTLGAASGLALTLVRHATRLIRRGALIVAAVSAGMSAVVVSQHRSLFADPRDAESLEALAKSPAIRVMFGNPVALDDPGGFTVWRTGTPIAVLVAVWALLTTIRITRGDEETGRWDMLLAGRYRLGRLVGLHLAVVIAATILIAAAVSTAMIMTGAAVAGSVLYGTALALIGAGVAAWAALAGQLIGDPRRAAVLGAAGIGASLLARMVADGVEQLAWLHWWTPFGLLGQLEPFAANRVAPLTILLAAVAAFTGMALAVTRRRDLGAGTVPVRDRHRRGPTLLRLTLLRSLPRFAVRRSAGSVIAWGLGVWSYFLVIGLLASSVTTFLADNPMFAEMAAQAGFGTLTTVTGFMASLFALLAVPLGLYGASRVNMDAHDEQARRLTMVFAAPVSRRRRFLVELAVVGTGTVILAAGAGVASWAGAVAVGTEVSAAAVAGAVNVVPVAWLSLGAALLAFGWLPQAVIPIGAIPAVGGFLLQVLAESLRWPNWVLRLSPYEYLNAVPYENVDWAGTAGMTTLAVGFCLGGLVGLSRRDLQG